MIAIFDVIFGASLLKFCFVSERASRGRRGFFGPLLIAIFDGIVGASLLKFCFVSERASRGWRGFFGVSLLTLFLGLGLVILSLFRVQKPSEN